jgi:hypothetical protein
MKKPKINPDQKSFFISVPRANGAKVFELLEQICSFTIKMQPKKKNVEIEIHSTDPAIVSRCHEIAKMFNFNHLC